MTPYAAAVAIACPRCGVEAGERCAGIDLGSHVARIDAWQRQQRAQHVAPPEDERTRVKALLQRVREERGW